VMQARPQGVIKVKRAILAPHQKKKKKKQNKNLAKPEETDNLRGQRSTKKVTVQKIKRRGQRKLEN